MTKWACPGLSVRVVGGIGMRERGIWEGFSGKEEKGRREEAGAGMDANLFLQGEHGMKAGRGLTSLIPGSSGVSYGASELPGVLQQPLTLESE